jgi:hypothetical protein
MGDSRCAGGWTRRHDVLDGMRGTWNAAPASLASALSLSLSLRYLLIAPNPSIPRFLALSFVSVATTGACLGQLDSPPAPPRQLTTVRRPRHSSGCVVTQSRRQGRQVHFVRLVPCPPGTGGIPGPASGGTGLSGTVSSPMTLLDIQRPSVIDQLYLFTAAGPGGQ